MQEGILIVDEDKDCRKKMAEVFSEAGYNVTATDSIAAVLNGVLKKTAQVVIIGSSFDELTAADLIPLLKQCNRQLTIILISADTNLPLMRRLRKEGIFYHALKPVNAQDREEIRQAVQCALESRRHNQC